MNRNVEEVLKIAKWMFQTNQDIIGEQYRRSDDGVLEVSGIVKIDKDMTRGPISKMKKGKAVGPSKLVLQVVKVAGEAGNVMVTDLVSQIIVE